MSIGQTIVVRTAVSGLPTTTATATMTIETADDQEVSSDDTITRELHSGVEVIIRHTDTGVEIEAIEEGSLVYDTSTDDRDFHHSRTKVGTIANAIGRHVSPDHDPEAVAYAFRSLCMDLRIQGWWSRYRPPTVERLVEETSAVTFTRKKDDNCINAHLEVEFTVEGRTATFRFSMAEWTGDGSETLQEQYAAAFMPNIVEVTSEHWDLLTDEWAEQATVIDETDDEVSSDE